MSVVSRGECAATGYLAYKGSFSKSRKTFLDAVECVAIV